MLELAAVDRVTEQVEQHAAGERIAADRLAAAGAQLGAEPLLPEFFEQRRPRAELEIAAEDVADGLGILRVNDQLTVSHDIADRHDAVHPQALLLGGGDLVADALAGDSRSNWANESSTLRISRPMLVVVLNDWVTDTKLALA